MSPKHDPDPGFNVQITKVTDLGGGHETFTMNTHLPPDVSLEDADARVQFMREVMQREIARNVVKEERRQGHEREKPAGQPFPNDLATPVKVPVPGANGSVTEQ